MKKNIAVVMGGYSSEVDISIKSGNMVYNHLNQEKYNAFKVLILKDRWVYQDENLREFPINKEDFSTTVNGYKIRFDFVFNAIHGHPGEDGTLLAYFELLGIPHSSSPFYQMAVAFNKRDCISFLKPYGIPTARSVYLNRGDDINEVEIINQVGLPCFVKPNRAGSSFGISKVNQASKLAEAIELAFSEDDEILIEEFLNGTEVSVGVITFQGAIRVLPITEIVSENDFFDFEAKYQGKSEEITPARINKNQKVKVEQSAKRIYKKMKLTGFSRADFIFVGDEPYFIELNMVPGMSEESIFPKQVSASNISFSELIDDCINQD